MDLMNFKRLAQYDQIIKLSGQRREDDFPLIVRGRRALIDLSDAEINIKWKVSKANRFLIEVGEPDGNAEAFPFFVQDGLLVFEGKQPQVGVPTKVKCGMLRFDPNEWDKMAWGEVESLGEGPAFAWTPRDEWRQDILSSNFYMNPDDAMQAVDRGQRHKITRRVADNNPMNMRGRMEGIAYQFEWFPSCDIIWPETPIECDFGFNALTCGIIRARTASVAFLTGMTVDKLRSMAIFGVDSRISAIDIDVYGPNVERAWPINLWGGSFDAVHVVRDEPGLILAYERRPSRIAIGSIEVFDSTAVPQAFNCNGPCDSFRIGRCPTNLKWTANGTPPIIGE